MTGRSKYKLFADAFYSVFKYNISLTDYFSFRFFQLDSSKRAEWAGTGFMYEYQLRMNPHPFREVLENKKRFNDQFREMVRREYYTLYELSSNQEISKKLCENPTGKIVLKNSLGQAGRQVQVLNCSGMTHNDLISYMRMNKFDLAEEYIIQHPSLMNLSSTGLNTVRIITQENNGKVEVLAARLRISINSQVDNLAAGNTAAPVDIMSGLVSGPGVFSDISKSDISVHPVTHVRITEFQVPFWAEVIELVNKAALLIPSNRSVGWDVAIRSDGPLLIEGNHNWCKLLWQLPVKKGLKKELEKYL
jgi:hypothetical protein